MTPPARGRGRLAAGWLLLLLAGGALGAVTTRPAPEDWQAALLAERAAKDHEFATSATSPLAGTLRFSLPADETVTGEQTTRLGRYTLRALPGAGELVVQVFDPARKVIRQFSGLRYFPPDPGTRVMARLERLPAPDPVTVTTSRKLEKRFFRAARLHFTLAGQELVLTAYLTSLDGPGAREYFVPFQDATTGAETYEVGRFLDIPVPAAGDEVLLDFNRAYNPLCNYSPAYNCPLPPRENWLDVPIRAGERTYPHE